MQISTLLRQDNCLAPMPRYGILQGDRRPSMVAAHCAGAPLVLARWPMRPATGGFSIIRPSTVSGSGGWMTGQRLAWALSPPRETTVTDQANTATMAPQAAGSPCPTAAPGWPLSCFRRHTPTRCRQRRLTGRYGAAPGSGAAACSRGRQVEQLDSERGATRSRGIAGAPPHGSGSVRRRW